MQHSVAALVGGGVVVVVDGVFLVEHAHHRVIFFSVAGRLPHGALHQHRPAVADKGAVARNGMLGQTCRAQPLVDVEREVGEPSKSKSTICIISAAPFPFQAG